MENKRKVVIGFFICLLLFFGTFIIVNSSNHELSKNENSSENNQNKNSKNVTTGSNEESTDSVTILSLNSNNKNKQKINYVKNNKKSNSKKDVKGPEITFTGGSKSYKKPSNENITIKLKDRSEIKSVSYLITQSYDNKGNYGEEVTAENIIKNEDGTYSVVINTAGLNGGYYVFVKATDKLGNESTIKGGHFYIDTTAPELSFAGGSRSSKKYSNSDIILNIGEKNNIKSVSYLVKQGSSNKGYGSEISSSNIINNGDGTYSVNIDISNKRGGYYIFAKVIDVAGNETVIKGGNYYIDTIVPTATISYSTTEQTTNSVIATLEPSEEIIVTNNNGETTYTFTENGEFTFEFVDKSGNSGSATAIVNNIIS